MSDYVKIPAEAIPDLRRALAWGLYAIAEVDRVREFVEMRREIGQPLPDDACPIQGMGSTDSMTEYASAFLWLDCAVEVTG